MKRALLFFILLALNRPAPVPGAPAAGGDPVFTTQCAECHGAKGEGDRKLNAPAVAGLPDYYVVQQLEKFQRHLRGLGTADKKEENMHAMAASMESGVMKTVAQTIAAQKPVVSAPTVIGDKALGKAIYERHCGSCHGAVAEGNAAKESPPLFGFQDWYLVGQIEKFREGTRKADPFNFDSVQMHAMAQENLKRKRDIRNVVAFITDQLTGEKDAEP